MRFKRTTILLSMLLIILLFSGTAVAQSQAERVYVGNIGERPLEYVPGRVLVKFAESVLDDEAEQIIQGLGARFKRMAYKRAFRFLSVPRERVWHIVRALRRHPKVLYAHPDWLAYATSEDPLYNLQWHFYNDLHGGIELEGAWDISPGGVASIRVAVLDSGIAYENYAGYCQAKDLEGTSFVSGYDFINSDSHPNDDNSHGTHVAGTIAQTTNNGIGVAGIAYNISLMPVKVLDSNGSGAISDIAEGIRYAADHGAHIINMSFGTSAPRFWLTALENAVEYAHSRGVLQVASAGNGSANNPLYPARYEEVIAVGATTFDEALASYSNRGNELCAPGGTDLQDLNGDGYPDMVLQNTFDPDTRDVCDFAYWFFSGTSMAAPHVSGLAALILSVNPSLTNEQVREVLRDTADDIGVSACGYGLINATEALLAVAGGDSPPTVTIIEPSDGDTVSGSVTLQIEAYDNEDAASMLAVEWSLNGGAWQRADYNAVTGYYEAQWDTTSVNEGDHTINARAMDTASNESTDSVKVLVDNNNDPPVASFTITPSGLTCDFDASGSTDSDGTIISYKWVFGDGESEVSTIETTSHTYAVAGTYTVTLAVTDNDEGEDEISQNVTVEEGPDTMHVADLYGSSYNLFWRIWRATVTVTVNDNQDDPVEGATVYGVFSDGSTVFQCTTNGDGTCNVSGYQWQLNCLTYTVVGMEHDTLVYDPIQDYDVDPSIEGTNITVCRP